MGKTIHGMKRNPLYIRWDSMMQRCYNPNHNSYKNYGARGIIVSEEFKDCKVYVEYILTLDKPEGANQIDRIENSKNYERGNLRWVTAIENNLNKRTRSDNTSGYQGVAKAVNSPKWRSYLYLDSKTQVSIGIFDTIKEAVEARNEYIIKNNLKHKIQAYV